MMGLRDVVPERRVLVKRCRASGLTEETHLDFGLGATGPRLLAPLGPFKALARTGPTVEKRLLTPIIVYFFHTMEVLGDQQLSDYQYYSKYFFLHSAEE